MVFCNYSAMENLFLKYKKNVSLFLVSFSIFLYQVCLLRIISISDYYHFAFLIISIALLGFGISGSFLPFFVRKIEKPNLILLIFSFSFSVSIFLSFTLINLIPFDSFRIAWEIRQLFFLLAYYFFLLLPFFFGGSFIGYVLYSEEKPGVIYFINLIGSSIGSILFILLLPMVTLTGIVFISTVVGLVATYLLISKRYFKVFISLGIVFMTTIILISIFYPAILNVRMSPYKSLTTVLRYPSSRVVYTAENSYSKVDVIESPSIKSAPGLSLKYTKVPPDQLGITTDGDNLSPITKAQKDISNLDFLNFLPLSVVFGAKDDIKDILIIEPGGGLDVLSSVFFTKPESQIFVVQSNNLIVNLMKKDFKDFNGDIYNKSNVHVIETSSRNFSKSTNRKFDLIILSLSDTFHPVSSGAYSLNENYLYTTDSFANLLNILKKGGILAITRWVQFPPSEDLKIMSTIAESTKGLNIKELKYDIFAFRSWSTVTILFNIDSFNDIDISRLKEKIKSLNYDIVYYNGAKAEETNIFNKMDKSYYYEYYKQIIEGNQSERKEFYRDYYFNTKPADDNNPYYYNFFKLRQIPEIIKYFGKSTQPFGGGGYLILIAALVISIIMALLLILLPLKLMRAKIKIQSDYKFLIYFLALGFGFFLIELPFIQRFILILGRPAYSLSVILFSLLLSAGLGSFTTSRFKIDLKWPVLIIVIYIVLFIAGIKYIDNFIISKVFWQRFILTILFVMPLGFFMGMPFPLGIIKVKEKNKELIPWLWAVNGSASVVSSIAAVIISIHLGFLVVIGIAAIMYVIALMMYKYGF